MEILRLGELLADQRAADDVPVHAHERSARLLREEELRERRHDARIDEARDDAQHQCQDDRGTELALEHGHTSRVRTSRMSIALMPTNGMMMPPTP